MKIHQVDQGSEAWAQLRAAIPTASEFGNLVSPTFEVRTGQMPATYLHVKLAEKWIGGALPGFSSWATEQGQILEDEAIKWLKFEMGVTLDRVGFITDESGRFGCSPDGLIGSHSGIELKCPGHPNHVSYLLAGCVPPAYQAQVQGALFVTGRPQWSFLSYHRGMPNLYIEVEPNPKAQEALAEALALFQAKFDLAWKRLCELNGAPPEVKPDPSPDRPRFSWEQQTEEYAEIVP